MALAPSLRTLSFPSLIVFDEIDYLQISRTGTMLFFHLLSERYDHASTHSDQQQGAFEDWGKIFEGR